MRFNGFRHTQLLAQLARRDVLHGDAEVQLRHLGAVDVAHVLYLERSRIDDVPDLRVATLDDADVGSGSPPGDTVLKWCRLSLAYAKIMDLSVI